MIRSTIRSSIKLSKHYLKMNAKELRHRAGVAWVRGKLELAELLERLAVERVEKRMPGEHGFMYMPRRTSYIRSEHHLIFGHKRSGAQ